jgi:hypothetical protein
MDALHNIEHTVDVTSTINTNAMTLKTTHGGNYVELSDYDEATANALLKAATNGTNNGNTIVLLAANPVTQSNQITNGQNSIQLRPISTTHANQSNGGMGTVILQIGDINSQGNSTNNKEWQFLQTAISEAGLTDFYHTYTGNSNSDSQAKQQQQQTTSLVTMNEVNIEAILQMQCELLDQQKELKSIEMDTLEQLKQLHTNISRLARKFDAFETSVAAAAATSNPSTVSQQQAQTLTPITATTLLPINAITLQNGKIESGSAATSAIASSSQNSGQYIFINELGGATAVTAEQFNAQAAKLNSMPNQKSTKSTINKINSTIQQIKVGL